MAQENNTSSVIENTKDRPVVTCKLIRMPRSPVKLTFDEVFPDFDKKNRIRKMPSGFKIFSLEMTKEFKKKYNNIRPAIISNLVNSKWKKLSEHERLKYHCASRHLGEIYSYKF